MLDSKEEEKGSNCVESFQAMQLCSHQHPEHCKDFLGDDDKETDEQPADEQPAKSEGEQAAEAKAAKVDSDWYLYSFAK